MEFLKSAYLCARIGIFYSYVKVFRRVIIEGSHDCRSMFTFPNASSHMKAIEYIIVTFFILSILLYISYDDESDLPNNMVVISATYFEKFLM